ncbi:MAG: CoA transferase [Acidimicrobiia bacterium]
MLQGLSVIELAGSPAGGYAAKLLAEQGAEVALVGVPSRPWAVQVALDGAKRPLGVLPDAEVAALVAAADVVIESSAPDPLRPQAGPGGRWQHPGLVAVRIAPFSPTGPYARWRSTDCTDHAISGHLRLTGDPDREPLQGPALQPAYAAGVHAAIGALAALEARRGTGVGQVVSVSHHEVMVALHQFTLLRHTHNGDILNRLGNRYAGPGSPIGLYHCADGPISLTVPRDDQLERLLAVAGLSDLLDDPEVASTYDLMHHPTLLEEHLLPWLASQAAEETVQLLQAVRVPAAPVRTMAGLLADEHLQARGVWGPSPLAPAVRVPRPPMRLTPLGDAQPGQGAATGAVHRSIVDRQLAGANGPLHGLRVVDLTRVWAGPLATRILADLGADVVMVEAPWARGPAGIDRSSVLATHYYPDDEPGDEHWNRIGFVNKYAINKRSVALDVSDPDGLAALEALLRWADVVIENYSPRVMPQLGLDEARLAELNPSLVYVTMPGYGRSGPCVDWLAYGPMIDSHAGLSVLQGYPDEPARKGGVAWPDPVAGLHAAFAVLVALHARRTDRSGEHAEQYGGGLTVELAQLEATIAFVGHAVVAAQLDGAEPTRLGNRHPQHAPQGVYPAAGTDRWLALTVVDDAGWRALVSLAGLEAGWASGDATWRRARHDEIDRALAGWSAKGEAAELAAALQRIGVPAAPVTDAAEVLADPQLSAADAFVALEHPAAGTHRWPRLAVRLERTPATYRRPAPRLGEHNVEVLTECAGLDAATIGRLLERGVLAIRPPG